MTYSFIYLNNIYKHFKAQYTHNYTRGQVHIKHI